METLSLFSQSEFPEKGMVYRNWISQVMLLEEKCNLIFVFMEVQAERTDSGFPKSLQGGVFLCLLNIFATVAPKSKHFKNYLLILAIVNYRNWLDASLNFRDA